jgi:hypothetical protein
LSEATTESGEMKSLRSISLPHPMGATRRLGEEFA